MRASWRNCGRWLSAAQGLLAILDTPGAELVVLALTRSRTEVVLSEALAAPLRQLQQALGGFARSTVTRASRGIEQVEVILPGPGPATGASHTRRSLPGWVGEEDFALGVEQQGGRFEPVEKQAEQMRFKQWHGGLESKG